MRVQRIVLEQFMSHRATTVDLPEAGIVLVTGENGAGKSSLVEAVSVALWGRTLRGTKPWAGKGGAVGIKLYDGLSVRRQSGKLVFATGGSLAEYDTPTKAQAALDKLIPERELWARSRVFSSADAALFSTASDGERKRLLESLHGLGRLDDALAACRVDLRAVELAVVRAKQELAVHEMKIQGIKQRIDDSKEAVADAEAEAGGVGSAEPPSGKDPAKALRRLDAELRGTREELATVRERIRAADAHDVEGDVCGTCGQAIGAVHRKRILRARKEARASLVPQERALRARAEELAEARAGLLAQQDAARAALERARVAQEASARARAAQGRLEALRVALSDAQDEADELGVVARGAEGRAALLRAAEKVLGLQGVRAHLLGQCLAGIEQAANTWLARIAATGDAALELRLSPYAERAGGGARDAISLDVLGAGNGYGYRAASSGERRRIDVALLLALAEIAEAANGAPRGGTMFFDEVFDALDRDGVASVCEVIEELARDSCVVLISHNQQLVRRVSPALHLHVQNGAVGFM